MDEGTEGDVPRYPTPDELWNRTFAEQNAWRDRFATVPFEDRSGDFQGRYYQDIAIERVLESIAAGKQRILLTLATGTGKTFIAFQLAWKLFQSRWNLTGEPNRRPRILFLADRNILANQAFNAFSAFPEDAMVRIEPADIKKKGKVPKNGSLFFTIFQSFMSGPPKEGEPSPYFGEYPPDFFYFIVIDECQPTAAETDRQTIPFGRASKRDTTKDAAAKPLFTVPAALVKILNRDIEAAGIPKRDERVRTVDVHALRHSFGTLLSKGGVSPRTAQAAMRHSKIELTMGVYTDPKLLDVAGAMDCLPSLSLAATQPEALKATGTYDLLSSPPCTNACTNACTNHRQTGAFGDISWQSDGK
jgi:hypothetical protein